jgi:hypothetical protein
MSESRELKSERAAKVRQMEIKVGLYEEIRQYQKIREKLHQTGKGRHDQRTKVTAERAGKARRRKLNRTPCIPRVTLKARIVLVVLKTIVT